MPEQSDRPFDTREFVSRWNAATEEHLVHQVQRILEGLSRRGTVPGLTVEQVTRLSPIMVRALQVAGAPNGGPHAAIQYLSELDSERDEAPR
jgi:hypothetical protein